jgi:hypothetical protein
LEHGRFARLGGRNRIRPTECGISAGRGHPITRSNHQAPPASPCPPRSGGGGVCVWVLVPPCPSARARRFWSAGRRVSLSPRATSQGERGARRAKRPEPRAAGRGPGTTGPGARRKAQQRRTAPTRTGRRGARGGGLGLGLGDRLLGVPYRILFESRGQFWGLLGATRQRALEGR